MKHTAVEWLVSELKKYDSAGLKDQSNYVIEMPTHILTELEEQAKEMEKEQQGYSEEDINEMFDTLKRNSVDNVAKITNVDLFINSWKRELKNK